MLLTLSIFNIKPIKMSQMFMKCRSKVVKMGVNLTECGTDYDLFLPSM